MQEFPCGMDHFNLCSVRIHKTFEVIYNIWLSLPGVIMVTVIKQPFLFLFIFHGKNFG